MKRGLAAAAATAALFGGVVLLPAGPAAADEAKYYLECPATVTEGGTLTVTMVRVGNDPDVPNSGFFSGQVYTAAETALADDDFETVSGASYTTTDQTPDPDRLDITIDTVQDLLTEGPERFEVRVESALALVDPADPDRDNKCSVTIVDDEPSITGVEVISAPANVRDGAGTTVPAVYGVGEVIEFEMSFSHDVEIATNQEPPRITIQVGDEQSDPVWAQYRRQSANDKVVFGYTVAADDSDADGVVLTGSVRDVDETVDGWRGVDHLDSIRSTVEGTVVTVWPHFVGSTILDGHTVDGSRLPHGARLEITSQPGNGGIYRWGEEIEFTLHFTAAVDLESGSPGLLLQVGGDQRAADYVGGSGTGAWEFEYGVGSSDSDSAGLSLVGTWFDAEQQLQGWTGNGQFEVTANGADFEPQVPALEPSPSHDYDVDGRPYPKRLSIASTPQAHSDTYGRGEVILLEVDFDQPVTAAASAEAPVWIGHGSKSFGTQRHAKYLSGNGTDTLTFAYTVTADDSDDDGVTASVFHYPTADITATGTDIGFVADAVGNTPSIELQDGHKVDGNLDVVAPTVTGVEITSDPSGDNGYGTGDAVTVKVTFSEDVTVTSTQSGDIKIGIDVGGTTRDAIFRAVDFDTLSFDYTVAVGDLDADGISIAANSIMLSGAGAVADKAGNAADLGHDAVPADNDQTVNSPGGL